MSQKTLKESTIKTWRHRKSRKTTTHTYKSHKTTTKRHSRSLTTMNGRTNGDVAHLRVEGELVDVHFAGADHLHVLLRRDRPIIRHVHVGILRGLVFLYPDTSYWRQRQASHMNHDLSQQTMNLCRIMCLLTAALNNSIKSLCIH